jgi:hypothetical protein
MDLKADLAKGTRAEMLLKSDIYRESVGKVRQGIIDQWASSPIRDVEGQTTLRLMLKLLEDLEQNIVSMANTGKLAKAQIEHENKAKEMAKRAIEGISNYFSQR